jgi:hypothetical protein
VTGHTSPFPRRFTLRVIGPSRWVTARSAPYPPYVPRRDAEGGGRVRCTRRPSVVNGGPKMGASNAPARRLVAIRSALRNAERRSPSRGTDPSSPSLPTQSGCPEVSRSGLARRPYGASHAQPVVMPAGFPDGTPGRRPDPCRDCSQHGIPPARAPIPPATTGAGTSAPPLGRKGRAEDKGGRTSGKKWGRYARWQRRAG